MMPKTIVHCCGIEQMSGSAPAYMQTLVENKTGTEECSRCGETHEELDWLALDNPKMSAPEGVTPSAVIGYAMCPKKNQPIFLYAWDMPDDVEEQE